MHEYQRRVVDWMKQRDYGYLAIDMGLGKTRCVIEYLKETHQTALVVAPLQVVHNTWPNEMLKWTTFMSYNLLHGLAKDQLLHEDVQVQIINYDGLKWLFGHKQLPKWDVLILDESTAVKSRKTLRTKLLIKARKFFKKCFCLSATPAPNGIWDLWSQFLIMDQGVHLGSKWGFFQLAYIDENPFTHQIKAKPGAVKAITAKAAPAMISLKAEDYIKMPDYIHNDIFITLPNDLREKYETLEKDFIYAINQEEVITTVSAMALAAKLRQFLQGAIYDEQGLFHEVHSLKAEALQQVLDELNGTPTLVPFIYRFEVDLVHKFVDKGIPVIYGQTSQKDKDKLLKAWNEGKLPVLMIHPASVSHGVNLQSGGHYITWLGLTWVFEQYFQVNGRLRRQGQTHPVVVNRLLIRDTKDEAVAAALAQKGADQQTILQAIRA